MSEQNKPTSLDGLVEAATDSVRQELGKAAELANKQPPQPRARQIFTAMPIAIFAAVLLYQFPRFAEPYALPDPATNPKVIEAELEAIAGLIEDYRFSQGKYPESLNQVRLPVGLDEAVANTKLEYQLKENSYVLNWTPFHWQAVLDGATGKIVVTSANGAK
jgi:hypothetical protein